MTPTDQAGSADPSSAYRLPYTVEPRRYELRLAPDVDAARFTGEVTIEARALEPLTEIVLHAADLTASAASVTVGEPGAGGDEVQATVSPAEADERLVLRLGREVPAGPLSVAIRFDGVLNDLLHGFYRSTFVDDDGTTRTIATTQFEATDARRAFPCFDEPDRKAVFSITLDVPAGLQAFSNGPVESEEPLADGARRVRFADTIPMSTYLVAFVVGPLQATEPVESLGTPIRVVHRAGQAHLTSFALEVADHALRFFSEWFAIPYPAQKLDLVAIPDFAFGAMENLGCVTFRESALLVDPEHAARVELERIADVVAHEIAHMWFGDLVTMKWWNGIWLNEAFATLMELLCVDAFRPEWERWSSFGREREMALATDALHATRPVEYAVGPPAEAQGMFDVLTYQKGASVLRMLERFVGGATFRDGIRHYLDAHRLANTETADLWDALGAASGEPVGPIMDSWILQGGFPLVRVGEDAAGATTVEQAPFAYGPAPSGTASAIGERWQVPVLARGLGGGTARVLLGAAPATLAFEGTGEGRPGTVVANAGGSGFYRVAYGEAHLHELASALDALDPLERFNLFGDTWAAVVAGISSLNSYLALAEALAGDDPDVWAQVTGPLGTLEAISRAEDTRAALGRYCGLVLGPVLGHLGWEARPGDGERTPALRAQLIASLGVVAGDPAVVDRARAMFDDSRRGDELPPDLASAVLGVVAAHGGEPEFDVFAQRYREARTPQEELRYLGALGAFRDTALATRAFDMARTEIRTQNVPFLVHALLANPRTGEAAWALLVRHWDDLVPRLPHSLVPRMLEGVRLLCRDRAVADSVTAFLAAHPLEVGQRTMDQTLERLFVNVAFAARMAAEAPAALSAGVLRLRS